MYFSYENFEFKMANIVSILYEKGNTNFKPKVNSIGLICGGNKVEISQKPAHY
jgi:hypothetical protein